VADELELVIDDLAAGGDGVGRDAQGRVTFVPRTAPGERVRVRVVQAKRSFARGELVRVLASSAERVEPACRHFAAGCGGCAWQHVSRTAQRAAKQAQVTSALRKIEGVVVEPIADPCPPLGWRRRARFHVAGGVVGLYAASSQQVLAIDRCPQLEPALDAALGAVIAARPPDGELHLARATNGDVVVESERAWPAGGALVGTQRIVGVRAGGATFAEDVVELESGLWGGAADFAQASAAGNAALIATTRAALGAGPGRLLELFAGSGNLTRALVADRWQVLATDVRAPSRPIAGARFEAGEVVRVLARTHEQFDAVVLDPPRTGLEAAACTALAALHAPVIVYVSCDPATLARDLGRLAADGYRVERAWPLDLMPQTAHVEVVVRAVRPTTTVPPPA
jgi:23S rRNA (uracil1939-C5)-methyltransferase